MEENTETHPLPGTILAEENDEDEHSTEETEEDTYVEWAGYI